jgi:hypothetical protein
MLIVLNNRYPYSGADFGGRHWWLYKLSELGSAGVNEY